MIITDKIVKIFAVSSLVVLGSFGENYLEESALKKMELRASSQEIMDMKSGCVPSVKYSLEDSNQKGRISCQKML